MKTPILYIKRCLLVAALLTASALSVQAADTFKARVRTTAQQTMNISLSDSDTIPLSNLGTIYALSIDALITQPREASFVRIVLEDVEGHNYLVAESDRFRNDTTTVNLMEYCEETAQLNGITPLRLKCYLTHASLQLTGIYTSTEMPTRGMATEQELRSMKETQVQSVVDRINEYNVRHGKLWQAAATPYALRYAEAQGEIGPDDPYLANMKYYAGGLYEIGERSRQTTTYNSPYADSFNWSQTRHGKKWITPVRDQISNGICNIFAGVGVAEALTNLYFNDTINLNLSEEFICTYRYCHNDNYIEIEDGLEFIVTDSVIDEATMPYGNHGFSCNQPRPIGSESVKLSCLKEVSKGLMTWDVYSDSIKAALIKYGPGVIGGYFPNNSSYTVHYMALVGYGKAIAGAQYTVISNTSSSTITIDSSLAGKTFWICKNSFGDQLAHFINIICNDGCEFYHTYFAKTPVIRRNHTNSEIVCEDRDGDGYFNWGISENPPVTLPAWAFPEKDADDTLRYVGALHSNGTFDTINSNLDVVQVTTTITKSSPTFNRKCYWIKNGGKLIVTNEFHCLPDVWIHIDSGGTLEIQGGQVVNAIVEIDSGATLKISNCGTLVPVIDENNDFIVPLGANLEISEGSIQKSTVNFFGQ